MKCYSTIRFIKILGAVSSTICVFACNSLDPKKSSNKQKSGKENVSNLELKANQYKTNVKVPQNVTKFSAKDFRDVLWTFIEGSLVRGRFRIFELDTDDSTDSSPGDCADPYFQPTKEIAGDIVTYELDYSKSLPCNGKVRLGEYPIQSQEMSLQFKTSMACPALGSKDFGPVTRASQDAKEVMKKTLSTCGFDSIFSIKTFFYMNVRANLQTPQGELIPASFVEAIVSLSKAEEKPCQFDNLTLIESCRSLTIVRLFSESPDDATLFYDLEFTDIAYRDKLDKYPYRGELKFRLNDWTGTVKVQGDQMPLILNATNGQETINDLGLPPSKTSNFQLTSDPRRKMPKGISRYLP